MAGTITCTIDPTPHDRKPSGSEIGRITNRLKTSGPSIVTADELRAVILRGGSIVCGCYEPSREGWGAFKGMQLFMLDFDHPEKLEPLDALERCYQMHLQPLFCYFTFSATVDPWNPKFRLVFDAGEIIADEATAHEYLQTLLFLFPEADQSCSNLNRLFFGGLEIIDCVKVGE